MLQSEQKILRRLRRRLNSSRASVYLEFALILPLAVMMFCFAADFTRILRAEQQLEIAQRCAVDIEIHIKPDSKEKTPHQASKHPVKQYLMDFAKLTDAREHIYLKAEDFNNNGPFTVAVNIINKTLFNPDLFDDNLFWTLFVKFMKGIVNVLTFGSYEYFTNVVPRDRGLRVSCSAALPTLLPNGFYSYFSNRDKYNQWLMLAPFEPDMKHGGIPEPTNKDFNASTGIKNELTDDYRHRAWVYMPILDTAPIAMESLVRDIRTWPIIKPFL